MKSKLSRVLLITILISALFTQNTRAEGAKDHIRAFLLSLAIPGLGEYYAGSPGSARLFLASELAIWGGYYYNTLLMNRSRDDYLNYAAIHAGVNPDGSGTDYLNAMVSFDSSFDHNQYQLQVSGNPVLYDGLDAWTWETSQDRRHFKKLREQELDHENYVKYCVAGLIVNHFLSGLHASRLVRAQQESNAAVTVNVLDSGLAAHYSWSF